MMFTLVLGTAIAFSSCSKDDDKKGGGDVGKEVGNANSVTINGKSHDILECFCYEDDTKGSEVVFYFKDDELEGAVEVEFDGLIPSGDTQAAELEIEYGYWNDDSEGGDDYEGKIKNVPCNIKVSDGKCTFKASNVKVNIKREDGTESFEATVSVNYSGSVKKDY